MRVLLIWTEFPENIKFYALTNPTEYELDVLKKAHGGLINCTDLTDEQDHALGCINAALGPPENADGFDGEQSTWVARWHTSEVQEACLMNVGGFDQVFTRGFIL